MCLGRTRVSREVTESGTISGKNLGKHPGKKLGKELPDWVKTWVRRPGKTKTYMTRKLLCFGKRTFCTQEHQVYTRSIQ
jgi:hypothetical protein